MIKGDGIGVDVSKAAMFLAKKLVQPAYEDAAVILDAAIGTDFALSRLHPMESGSDMGTKATTLTLSSLMNGKLK